MPEPSDESDFDFTEEEVSETVCFIADGICGLFKLTGLSPIQKKTFGKRCYQVAKKRLPEYAKDNADVVGLALVTASIIGHKLIEKRSKQDNRNLREKGEGKDLPLQKVDAGDGEAVAV